MEDVASGAHAAIVKRDRGALQPLLHPYLHWVQADGQVVRGRTAAQAREATVRGSVSQAIRIGEAVANAADSPVAAVIAAAGAFRLVGGKVLDVRRDMAGGFMRGSVVIEGLGRTRDG